jgi:cobalamin synthase
LDRSSVAIKKWLPLSLAGAAISLITALVFHVPIGRAIVAIALVVILIFSGFLFRSFGRGEQGETAGNEKSIK